MKSIINVAERRQNMARTKKPTEESRPRKMKPALTDEAREKQLISLANDLAEKQLLDGTASSQVITHYLKLGSQREKLERERLQEENKLLRAKTEALKSAKDVEKLYADALKAMSHYSGNNNYEQNQDL